MKFINKKNTNYLCIGKKFRIDAKRISNKYNQFTYNNVVSTSSALSYTSRTFAIDQP